MRNEQTPNLGVSGYYPPLVFAAVGAAALLAYWNVPALLRWPACGMQRWFGLPCPFCGGTRALESLAQGDWLAGLLWNPLVMLACGLAAGWFGLWAVERLSGVRWGLPKWSGRSPGIVGVGLVVLNWLYLLFFLPE